MTTTRANRTATAGLDIQRIESQLRPLQIDMIALALQGKQLHWNLEGRNFLSLHHQLDDIVNDARNWVDELAERLVALGVWADGQPSDIARESSLSEVPHGGIQDTQALSLIMERVGSVAARARTSAQNLNDCDLGSQDLCLEIVRGMEKYHWMLRAQQP